MSLVLTERPEPGVVVVRLNRPLKLNALTAGLIVELGVTMDALAADDAVRAVVVTGAGRAFCAGLDLDELGEGGLNGITSASLRPMHDFPHPLIGAINGAAVTGGLEIALACDFRIASPSARFADTHARVGVVPGWGLSARLPQAVGSAWARQLSFTGDFVDAATALRIGLVNEVVVDDDRLLPRCVELAVGVVSTNRSTITRLRDLYGTTRDHSGAATLAAEQAVARGGFLMDAPDGFTARRDEVLARGRDAS